MKKLLKFLLYIVIIAFVGVIIYAFSIYKPDTESVSGNNVANTNSSKNNEVKVNNVIEEKVEKEEEKKEKKQDEKNEQSEIKNEVKEPVVSEEVSISSEEKALDLAKKEYGSDDGVYFNCEQTESNDVYIVSVRDSKTTKALAWYTVDVKNGTVK